MISRTVVVLATVLGTTSLFAAPQVRQDAVTTPDGLQAAVGADGQLRQPTPAEQRALAAQAEAVRPRSLMRLEPKVHASGMVSIALDESNDHSYVVRTDEDGNLVFTCAQEEDAQHFVAASASLDTIMRIRPAASEKKIRTAERE
jgi:hypothetical protein